MVPKILLNAPLCGRTLIVVDAGDALRGVAGGGVGDPITSTAEDLDTDHTWLILSWRLIFRAPPEGQGEGGGEEEQEHQELHSPSAVLDWLGLL